MGHSLLGTVCSSMAVKVHWGKKWTLDSMGVLEATLQACFIITNTRLITMRSKPNYVEFVLL